MSTRTVATALVLVATVLLAGCAGPFQVTENQTDSLRSGSAGSALQVTTSESSGPTIAVTGAGEASAEADLAVIRVSVTALADSADEARGQVASDANRLTSALADAGVPAADVTTVYFAIQPQYDYTDSDRDIVGYRAVHAFSVEVAPEDAGRIVDVAVGSGASQVDGVSFTLTDETRAELREQALTEAVTAARADADVVAAAAGLSVTGVQTISVGGGVTPYPVVYAEDARAGSAATSFQPGPVSVTATVSVTYSAV